MSVRERERECVWVIYCESSVWFTVCECMQVSWWLWMGVCLYLWENICTYLSNCDNENVCVVVCADALDWVCVNMCLVSKWVSDRECVCVCVCVCEWLFMNIFMYEHFYRWMGNVDLSVFVCELIFSLTFTCTHNTYPHTYPHTHTRTNIYS